VFCNRLKFNEFVKAAEIIWRPPAHRVQRLPVPVMRLLALKLLWLMACGSSRAKAWHHLPIDLHKGTMAAVRVFVCRERNGAKMPTWQAFVS
jgi:hypothetical protein